MSYAPVPIVKATLKNRPKINGHDQIKEICGILSDLALRDCDAAAALLVEPNRFVEIIPKVIAKEKLLKLPLPIANHG
jgi:hypothetical protein